MSTLSRFFESVTQWMWGLPQGEYGYQALRTNEMLSYAPIWSACQKIGGHIGSLPKCHYKYVEGGAEKETNSTTARLLKKPNPYQTGAVFYETLMVHSLIDGNGRAAIIPSGTRDKNGNLSVRDELIPLLPESTATGMLQGEKWHACRPTREDRLRLYYPDTSGEYSTQGLIMLHDAQVVHVLGLSTDGVTGIPLKFIGQRNLKGAIDTEKRFGSQMAKGYGGGLMLNVPPGVFRKQEDAIEFLEWFRAEHDTADNSGKTGMLREGITAQMLSSSNKDAEMLATRVFQRQDAALWMGLEAILGDDSSVSYNSLAEKNRAYLLNTLARWIVRLEQELDAKVLPKRQYERNTHYIHVETEQLLRADYATTVNALAQLITATIISPNEARSKLDMLPYEGGDSYGNPAITPGERGAETAEEPATEEVPAENEAAVAHFRHLIKTEAHRVVQGTSKPNYLAFLDEFYAHWEPKLADWLEEAGCNREAATTHCEQSKDRLLTVCDTCDREGLRTAIEDAVEHWPNRAESLVNGELLCLTSI